MRTGWCRSWQREGNAESAPDIHHPCRRDGRGPAHAELGEGMVQAESRSALAQRRSLVCCERTCALRESSRTVAFWRAAPSRNEECAAALTGVRELALALQRAAEVCALWEHVGEWMRVLCALLCLSADACIVVARQACNDEREPAEPTHELVLRVEREVTAVCDAITGYYAADS